MKAKVITPRTELPAAAQSFSGEIGTVIDAPDGREAADAIWLRFVNTRNNKAFFTVVEFHYKEIQLLTDEEQPIESILIPVGEYNGENLPGITIDKDYTAWQEIPNPECECEVTL